MGPKVFSFDKELHIGEFLYAQLAYNASQGITGGIMHTIERQDAPSPNRANMRETVLVSVLMMLGYGLYRSSNSTIYLSSFSFSNPSFIFMTDMAFNGGAALASIIVGGLFFLAAKRGRIEPLSVSPWPAIVLLLAMGLVSNLGLLNGIDPLVAGTLVAFAFATASTTLSLCWVELFAVERPSEAIAHIGLGTIVSVIGRYAFSAIDHQTALMAATALASICAALCLIAARRLLPCSLGDEAVLPAPTQSKQPEREAVNELGDTLLAFCALEGVVGLVNSFMFAAAIDFEGSPFVSNTAMAAAAALFVLVTLVAQRIPRATTIFRIIFPIISAMVVFVPILSEGYSRAFSIMLLLSYDFMAIFITYQVAYLSNKHRVSSYCMLGLSTSCANASLLVALTIGTIFGHGDAREVPDSMRFMVLSCAVIYMLAMVLVFFSRNRKRAQSAQSARKSEQTAEHTPLISENAAKNEPREHQTATATDGNASQNSLSDTLSSAPEKSAYVDPIELTCARLAHEHHLTEREVEVLALLARGRTNTYIAEELVVSPTTVRGHIRNIYSKLDVHKRQELIDLFQ